MSNSEWHFVEPKRGGLACSTTDTLGEVAVDGDVWLGAALAREERLTRLLSYGSLFFGLVAPLIGVGALIVKLVQG